MDDQPSFEKTISAIPGISAEQLEVLRSKFHIKKFTKNHFIGREGEVCHFTAYVEQGCVSNYRILENGKKSINHFAFGANS